MLDLIRKAKMVQSVTSVTLVNNVTKTIDVVVPDNKKWILLSFKVTNPDDVARTITAVLYKEAAKTNYIKRLMSEAAVGATAIRQWPKETNSSTVQRVPTLPAEIVTEENTLNVVWATGGASAGGTDADGLVVTYLEIDE